MVSVRRFTFGSRIVLALAFALLLSGMWHAAPARAQDPTPIQDSMVAEATQALPPVGQKIPWGNFIGAPVIPPATIGLWVWSEDVNGQEVLHLRSGSDGAARPFSGAIRTHRAGNFYDLAVVNGTGDDTAELTTYDEFTFSLVTTGGGEGVDVNWSGRWLYLDLFVNGAYVPGKIFVGASGAPTTGAPIGTRAGLEGLLTLPLTMLDGPTAFVKNIANGYYLYRDDKGRFHMRLTTTSENDLVTYRGHIVSEDSKFRVVQDFRGDARDFVRITERGTVVEFKFHTKGHLDGMDWLIKRKDRPDNMTFVLRMDGGMAAPNISLGSNPFGTIKAFTFRLVE